MKSSIYILTFVLLCLIQLSSFGSGKSQDSTSDESSDWGFTLNAGFCNKYLWRGITYDKGLILQPEAVVSYKDFYASLWGNFNLWDWDTDSTVSSETDLTLGYYHSFDAFDIEAYASYYYYFYDPGSNTGEINLGAYYPVGNFTLFARSYIDFLAYAGAVYGEFGTDYEQELSDQFSVYGTLMAGVGSKKFNVNYLDVDKSAFNLAGANIGVSYYPLEGFSINADFTLNINIDNAVKEALGNSSSLIQLTITKEF